MRSRTSEEWCGWEEVMETQEVCLLLWTSWNALLWAGVSHTLLAFIVQSHMCGFLFLIPAVLRAAFAIK